MTCMCMLVCVIVCVCVRVRVCMPVYARSTSHSCRAIDSIHCDRTNCKQAYTSELFVSPSVTACVCMRVCLCDAHIV